MDIVNVFIVTKKSGFKGGLFKMTRTDAMKFCSDSRTAGQHFMCCYTARPILKWLVDDGRYAELIGELNITILEG